MNLFELAANLKLDVSDYLNKLGQAEKNTNILTQKMNGAMGKAGKIVKAGFVAAGAATVAFVGSSVKAGAEFDSSMAQVAATMGTTVDKITELRDFAKEMGASTAFSATQSADALNYMALAGYDAQTSMSMLPTVLNLAAAGGMELATASDMVTDAQSALGLTLDETTAMVDKMAKASSTGNTSVAQLGEAILTVGGTAKTLKGGTTELNQVLTVLADNGKKGAEGGTVLRNMIMSLSAPTDQAKEALDGLGVSIFDAEGNMRAMPEILQDLGSELDGMNDSQRSEVMNKIFNKADIGAVNSLLGTSKDRWEEVATAIDNSQGSAEKMANTQLDNLEGDVTLFKSALEGTQIALSEKVMPYLRELVQWGTEKLSKITETIENGGLNSAFETMSEVVGKAKDAVKWCIDNFDTLLPILVGVTAAVVAFNGAMAISTIVNTVVAGIKAYQKANEGATVAQALLNTTLLANPFVLIATLIAGVVAAIVVLWNTNEDFRNKVIEIWNKVKEFFSEFVGKVKEEWEQLKEGIGNAIEGVKEFFTGLGEKAGELKDNLSQKWDDIKTAASEKFEAIKTAVSEKWDALKTKTAEIWGNIKGRVEENGGGIKGILTTYGEIYGELWQGAFNKINELTGGKLGEAVNKVREKLNSIKEKFTTTFTKVKDTVKNAIEKIKGMFNFTWSLPHIKLPHFSISPKGWKIGDLLEGKIPSLGISWYAKAMNAGMLLDRPTIFGMDGKGNLLGGGEAGTEVVVGANSLYGMIQTAVNSALNGSGLTQNIYINKEVATADELARAIRRESRYGLMTGAY